MVRRRDRRPGPAHRGVRQRRSRHVGVDGGGRGHRRAGDHGDAGAERLAGDAAASRRRRRPTTRAPTRIVSLSPTHTETLFAIGAGPQVIAVDDQSNYPPEAEAVQTDLSGYQPNVEAIAGYEPDLVVTSGDDTLTEQLEALGLTVWAGASATTFDEAYAQIEQLGAATGHVAEAAELVGQMQTDLDALAADVPTSETPLSIYHELSSDGYSASSSTFIGQIYELFGLRNIADTAEEPSGYPQLNAETIIQNNPDLIFLADTKCCGESLETVAARDGWDQITAVQNGHVFAMDDDVASRWGPRFVEYAQQVHDAVEQALVPDRLTAAAVAARSLTHSAHAVQVDAGTVPPAVPASVDASLPGNGRWYAVGGHVRRRGGRRRRDDRPGRARLVAGAARAARPAAARVRRQRRDRRRVEHRVDGADATRPARRPRRGDAVARRGELPGRVPQPARRALPARRGGRRRPRRDARVHGDARLDAGLARRPGAGRGVRRRPRDGVRDVRRRRVLRRQPHRCDARARRRRRVGARERGRRRSSCSATSTSSARSTRGSSAGSRRRSGTT